MSLFTNIAAAFNPKGSGGAAPATQQPAAQQPAARPSESSPPPAVSSNPAQRDKATEPAVESQPASAMAPEPAAVPTPASAPALNPAPASSPVAGPDRPVSVPPAATPKASTMQEIALHQFAAVHLRPAATPLPAAVAEAMMSVTPPAAEVAQPERATQTASIYAQAVAKLMEERGASARQRIVGSL